MPIRIGNKAVPSILVGNKRVSAVYFGSKLIWPDTCLVDVGITDDIWAAWAENGGVCPYGCDFSPNQVTYYCNGKQITQSFNGDRFMYNLCVDKGSDLTVSMSGSWTSIDFSDAPINTNWEGTMYYMTFSITKDTSIDIAPLCDHEHLPETCTVDIVEYTNTESGCPDCYYGSMSVTYWYQGEQRTISDDGQKTLSLTVDKDTEIKVEVDGSWDILDWTFNDQIISNENPVRYMISQDSELYIDLNCYHEPEPETCTVDIAEYTNTEPDCPDCYYGSMTVTYWSQGVQRTISDNGEKTLSLTVDKDTDITVKVDGSWDTLDWSCNNEYYASNENPVTLTITGDSSINIDLNCYYEPEPVEAEIYVSSNDNENVMFDVHYELPWADLNDYITLYSGESRNLPIGAVITGVTVYADGDYNAVAGCNINGVWGSYVHNYERGFDYSFEGGYEVTDTTYIEAELYNSQ